MRFINYINFQVKFSGKPEKVYLGEFLKKYNFIAFKRIEKTDNMFAAQVKTINDFDKVCSEREVKCGKWTELKKKELAFSYTTHHLSQVSMR